MLQNLTKGKYKKTIKVEDLLVSDTKMFVVNIDRSIFNAVMGGNVALRLYRPSHFHPQRIFHSHSGRNDYNRPIYFLR